MPEAYTKADSLAFLKTADDRLSESELGGGVVADEFGASGFLTSTPIPQIVIKYVSTMNGTGTGILSAPTASTLQWQAPGDTIGAPVTIAPNETKVIESNDPDKYIRVFWDGDYSMDDLGGEDEITILPITNGLTAIDYYAAGILKNRNANAQDITSIKAWIPTLATQRVTGTAQLPSSGAGTITTATANGFADWPQQGFAHIRQSGGASREIVYYSSRTATSLTVEAAGRALLGTSESAGAATDTVDCVPPIRIGFETADADNRIQEIPDDETAPTGITWSTGNTSATGITHATLKHLDNLGIWVNTEVPTNLVPSLTIEKGIMFEYTVEGETFNSRYNQYLVYGDELQEAYLLYVGEDTAPDLTAAPDVESASPVVYNLTPPMSGTKTFNYVLRKRNAWLLESLNSYASSITINSAGEEVTSSISNPSNVTLEQIGSGKLRVRAEYTPGLDADPADNFIGYIRTNGTDPDPGTDTPVTLGTIGDPDLLTGKVYLNYVTSAYDWNTDFRIIVRTERTSPAAESDSTTVTSTFIDTGAPPARIGAISANETFGYKAGIVDNYVEHSTSPECRTYYHYGITMLTMAGDAIFRAIVDTNANRRLYVDPDLSFVNNSISGAGTGSVEVVDANTIYLVVSGTRRAKIDLAGGTIEANEFIFTESIDDNPNTGPLDTDNGKLYYSAYNPSRSAWEPFLSLDSSGTLTIGYSVIQKDT